MPVKPKIIVLSGYGINCEAETAYAFELAGGTAEVVHINDLVAGQQSLKDYQVLAVPGGFSYGDDTGSGKAFANKIKNHLMSQLEAFVREDRLVIGICNGFQIIAHLGLLPALDNNYGERSVALIHNNSARYSDRWVDLEVVNESPWLQGMTKMSFPIAHGEGKFYADEKMLSEIDKQGLVALRYVKGEVSTFHDLPANPNGSLEDIAGITDTSGRVLGLMPHPERAINFTQLPHWTYLKEKYLRQGQSLPATGPGLQIFENAINYFK